MALLINRYQPAGEGVGLMKHDEKGDYVKHQDHEVLMASKDFMINLLKSQISDAKHEVRIRPRKYQDSED